MKTGLCHNYGLKRLKRLSDIAVHCNMLPFLHPANDAGYPSPEHQQFDNSECGAAAVRHVWDVLTAICQSDSH